MNQIPQIPSLAIIIVNWNSYEVTKNCLKSLRSVTYSNFKTIVVDNGSEDGSGEKLKSQYDEIILLKNDKNLGFTGGNNTGIKYALEKDFDYLMLLNNDTIVTEHFIEPLINEYSNDDSIGAVQPKILFNADRKVIWNAGGFHNNFLFTSNTRGYYKKDDGTYDDKIYLDWVTGCCFLVPTEIVKQIGGLDDLFFIYYEDADWSLKIRKLGYQLKYVPDSKIYHEVGMSNENRKGHGEGNVSPFAHYMVVRNHLYMVRRYVKGVYKIGAWGNQFFKIFGYLTYFLLRRRMKKYRAVLKGLKEGLSTPV